MAVGRTKGLVAKDGKRKEAALKKAKAAAKKRAPKKKIGEGVIALLHPFQKEIGTAYRKGDSAIKILFWLEKKGIKTSENTVRHYLNLLIEEGKVKKRLKNTANSGRKGPSETTLEKLNPHREAIMKRANEKKGYSNMLYWLRKRGVIVNHNTLKKYIDWVKSQGKSR